MKQVILLLLLLITTGIYGQKQKKVQVPVTQWGNMRSALIYAPTKGALSNGKYPAILFFHGVGEQGNNVDALFGQGLPWVIENVSPPYSVNPLTKDTTCFIVLSIQAEWWSPEPAWMPHVIKWLKDNYPVDSNYIYSTGLSAGGQNSFNALINAASSKYFAAGVPMSIAGFEAASAPNLAANKVKTWFFDGDADGSYLEFTKMAYNLANKLLPGSSKLTIYPGGHGPWTPYYNPQWKEKGVSIYDWMLLNPKGAPEQPVKKLVMTIRVFSDGSIEKE